jgi:hypothetical protein
MAKHQTEVHSVVHPRTNINEEERLFSEPKISDLTKNYDNNKDYFERRL